MSWTDERIEDLRRMWAEGLSASQIAGALGGVSRNAVIGKIHRLGLSGRVKTPSRAARKSPARAPSAGAPRTVAQPRVMAVGSAAVKIAERPEPAPVTVADVVPFSGGVSFLDLKPGQCRWPIGDPSSDDFRFCGAKTDGIYCEAHCKVAFPKRNKAKG